MNVLSSKIELYDAFMTNNNHIEKGMSTSGFVSYLTDAVNEAIDVVTEGVHT